MAEVPLQGALEFKPLRSQVHLTCDLLMVEIMLKLRPLMVVRCVFKHVLLKKKIT